jgi:hypothetical protein
VLIILLLHVPFSSYHSGFLIHVLFQSLNFLSSLCHSHFSNVIIFLRSFYLLCICCSVSSVLPSPSPSCFSVFSTLYYPLAASVFK